jgi:phage-related protein
MPVLQDIQKLDPGNLLTFYELDLTPCLGKFGQTTAEKFYWVDGVSEIGNNIIWGGREYNRYPIQTSGFDKQGDGSIPRPRLIVANIGGIIGDLAREYRDIAGAKLKRTRTFARYIDEVNFSKLNLLRYSNLLTNSAYIKNGVTVASGNVVTVTDTTNPYIYQGATAVGRVTDRVFSFGVKAHTTTAVGKYLRLFLYTTSPSEVYSTVVGPLANTPTVYSCTYKFKESDASTLRVRVDMEGSPSWSVNNTVVLSEWQANEGPFLGPYVETTTSRNPYADPSQFLDAETWIVDRKANENNVYVEWELTAPFDLAGIKLPRRQCLQNACPFRYRGPECSYTGTSYFDDNDKPTTQALDRCGKRLTSCKVRFGENAILPYGGFPAVGLIGGN